MKNSTKCCAKFERFKIRCCQRSMRIGLLIVPIVYFFIFIAYATKFDAWPRVEFLDALMPTQEEPTKKIPQRTRGVS